MTEPTGQSGPTADEIAGLVRAERTAGEYVPLPEMTQPEMTQPEMTQPEMTKPEMTQPDITQPPVGAAPEPASADPDAVGPGESVVRGSGDAAIAAAEERATFTRGRDIADAPPLPILSDTANVRHAPELHPDCRPLLPLIGVWRGTGLFGNDPDAKDPQFGQQITIAHDGRPFLTYESVSWLLGPDGSVTRPAARELGFWRPQPDGSIELLVAHSEGRIEVFYGQPRSSASWAMSTDVGWRTPTAPPVIGTTRLYGITPDGRLAYVEERAHSDIELAPHASAALERIAG